MINGLGIPCFFFFYINDLPEASQALDFHLLAEILKVMGNTKLKNISDGFIANKLTLNTSKPNFLVYITTRQKTYKI